MIVRHYNLPLTLRQGFTLLELLLVLVLIVIAMSLALPALNQSLKSWQLQSAADTVLAECNRARSRAIQEGEIYVFRFAPQSGKYMTAPWPEGTDLPDGISMMPSDNTTILSNDPARARNTVGNNPEFNHDLQFIPSHKLKILPDDITFFGIQLESRTSNKRANDFADFSVGSTISNIEWSVPILFFPDGMSSSAKLYLNNDRQQMIAITLRALTGSGRLSEIETISAFHNAPLAN